MFQIDELVYQEIREALTVPEHGGILGCDGRLNVIAFYHDVTGKTTKTNYIPDVCKLNSVINEWSKKGIRFVGFVHSHRKNRLDLSKTDVIYAKRIKSHCNMSEILMVIYAPDNNSFKIHILQ